MKGFTIGFVFGLVLMLGGCATTQPSQTSLGLSPKVEQTIKTIQRVCSFAPTVATVVKLVNNAPATVSAIQLATEVCLAISSVPLAEGGTRLVKVRGVVIKGKRI